ncbi:MAG TPA: hypothetical protein VHB72_01460 [Candidatus Saccharimonadales bacterium]|nr:hypothetical protein [Candidatus Saccharimonadales bacterium]
MERPSLRRAAEEGSWRLFQLQQFLDATHGSTKVATSLLTVSHLAQEISAHPLADTSLSPSKVSFYGFIGYRVVRSLRDKYDGFRIPEDAESPEWPSE